MVLKAKITGICSVAVGVSTLLMLMVFHSCSVKYSFTGASTVGLSTMSIQYFQNRASLVQPALSQNLTEALIDRCKAQTNLRLVDELGDVSFEGEISDYRTATLTISGDARAAMNRFTITVKVKFINTVDPDNSFEQSFSRYKDYDSNMNLSEVEDEYSREIVEMLTEDIFNRAFVNW